MRERLIDREYITGAMILISIVVIILSVVSMRFLDVKVTNLELIDRGLYTIITDNGPINVSQDDILRIERTYTKVAITGTPVELDRIYTTKGFIFLSSLDPFYQRGHQLLNSVDDVGKSVWIRSDKIEAAESAQSWQQRLETNQRTVQPFNYAIGTPAQLVPLVFAVLTLQYLALSVGGIALLILIFPLRGETPRPPAVRLEEQEYSTGEEVGGVVAK